MCHLFDRHSLLSTCAQVESEVLETFLVVDNDSSKQGAGAKAATAAQGDWLASRPVRRPCGSVCTRLAYASLVCSLEAPYAGPPAYFYIYSRV